MSQRESTARQHLIIKKLQSSKRATFDEIMDYLSLESELQGYNFDVSKRTFQRDIRDIGEVYRIYIKFDYSGKFYSIEEDDKPEIKDRLLEAFDVYNALKVTEQSNQHLYLEKRQAQGTEHLLGLLHAIKNRLAISIAYQKYYRDHVSQRTLEPLALKESKYRWYLFARDVYDGRVKIYGLDRITDLDISKKKFQKDPNFDLNQMMKHTFGIITPSDEKPQKVVLSFEPNQGKYIKSLPLHETQKILIDNEKEFRISLNIYLAYDFTMEILSYGEHVKVLEPKRFVEEMKDTYSKALELYS
jgi:predicted DNA-binding transcriptional regulator YafY